MYLSLHVVYAVVTIFKSDLAGKEAIALSLEDLCNEVAKLEHALVYSPKSGKLFEFLNTLRDNGIDYRTHFDSSTTDTQ